MHHGSVLPREDTGSIDMVGCLFVFRIKPLCIPQDSESCKKKNA